MDSCDVLVVGGGPAGSTCAGRLVRAGLDVVVIDKSSFPRDKVCAGWITPEVVRLLELDLPAYAKGRKSRKPDRAKNRSTPRRPTRSTSCSTGTSRPAVARAPW